MDKIVLVDIDGTISKVGERLKYLQQKPIDWDSFYNSCFEDEPIDEIIDLVKHLSKKYQIVYCTGRRECVRDITKKWIQKHIHGNELALLFDDFLIMRPNGDKRHDTETKPDQLLKSGWKIDAIAFVLEDRNSMVKKWRDMGLKCLQVAEGNF